MKAVLNSFYAKLSLLFLVLMLALGTAITLLSLRAGLRFTDEAEQKLNQSLAANLAAEFEPHLIDMIDQESIRQKIDYLMLVNPRIEIYLLDPDGTIKASFLGPDKHLAHTRVDPEPLDQYVQGAEMPILSIDPLHADRRKPFSAAHIVIMGEPECWLYIILGSEQYDSAASMLQNSYIMRTTLKGLGITFLFTFAIGLLLFGLLTRRLRGMKDVVRAFEQGQYNQRIAVTSSDEIGELGVSFNQMADTIVANLEDLQRTDRLRRELIANVSHDLRSPLAAIQGYLETIVMKDDAIGPEEKQRYLDIVLKNTQSLSTLVAELFELSKLDAEEIQPRREVFSLAELVQDVVVQFIPQAEALDVQLRAELPDRLPPVEADIALVERALSNLIDNALRYTPAGGVVRLALEALGSQVHVQVADTGRGIPPEDLPHIFERSYRVEKSRARGQGGAGLGLAITKKILELHGSDLAVRSTLDEGTTFGFSLPIADDSSMGAGKDVSRSGAFLE